MICPTSEEAGGGIFGPAAAGIAAQSIYEDGRKDRNRGVLDLLRDLIDSTAPLVDELYIIALSDFINPWSRHQARNMSMLVLMSMPSTRAAGMVLSIAR